MIAPTSERQKNYFKAMAPSKTTWYRCLPLSPLVQKDVHRRTASPLAPVFTLTGGRFSVYASSCQVVCVMSDYRSDFQIITTEQVAKILGVSKRTLKTWLQKGKISEPDRNPKNNYRIWTLADVEAIRLILGNEDQ